MALDRAKRDALVQQYADGPARLRAALATVPSQALKWRPAPKEWSAHEIVCHCADSETNSYTRVRFVVAEKDDKLGRPRIYSPIDEKTKTSPDPHKLARVRDLLILPAATLLVDRWDEDWTRLGWLRLYGRAELLEPQPHEMQEHAWAVGALRAKYEQYAGHQLESRPIIRITADRSVSWGRLD